MKLRLAESIRLGSLLIPEPEAGDFARCAVGMAGAACGVELSNSLVMTNPELISNFRKQHFSWLTNMEQNCPVCGKPLGCFQIVWHQFDVHVMGDKCITLEALCDWIDSIDPTPRTFEPADEPQVQEPAITKYTTLNTDLKCSQPGCKAERIAGEIWCATHQYVTSRHCVSANASER